MDFPRFQFRCTAARAFAFILALAAMAPQRIVAAPSWGDTLELDQPDGRPVQVRTFGDEFYLRVEGLDGYTLMRDPMTGYLCYAQLNADSSDWISTGLKYSGGKGGPAGAPDPAMAQAFKQTLARLRPGLNLNRDARQRLRLAAARDLGLDRPEAVAAPFSPLGKISADSVPNRVEQVTGLIIPVEFPDARATISKQQLEDLANLPGYAVNGNNGSIRDYWLSVSRGRFDFNLVVAGYYLAKHDKSYYDRAEGYAGGQELVEESLQALKNKGFDFSPFSTRNGTLRSVNIMYVGASGKTWAQGIWPHRGSIGSLTLGSVKVSRYMMTNIGTAPTIGTFCHESGHLLFEWPDLYDMDYDSKGAGGYCLMSFQGTKNPQPPNPWLRAGQGWETLLDPKTAFGGLLRVPSNGRGTLLVTNPANSKEAYLVENILRRGHWAGLRDSGLLVWHVDDKGNNNWQDRTEQRHYRVAVVQADNKFDLEENVNNGAAGDMFRKGGKTALSATTSPNSKWWNGSPSGLDLSEIGPAGDTLVLRLSGIPLALARPIPAPDRGTGRLAEGVGNPPRRIIAADGRTRVRARRAWAAPPASR